MATSVHQPVLLEEVVTYLSLAPGAVFVDATAGGGGHAAAMCKRYGPNIKIVAIDQDRQALERTQEKLDTLSCSYTLHRDNFSRIDTILSAAGIDSVDAVLFDLGFSSDQLEVSGRGFSFKRDEPLLMTLSEDGEQDFTAREILNEWDEQTIADILFGYGEERYARRIAKAIVSTRTEHPIETTFDLVSVVEGAVPAAYRHRKVHPATKTFQALRIAVNRELAVLEEGLKKAQTVLKDGGRIAVITFHSIEDRIVKQMFREWEESGYGRRVTKKTIKPSAEEISSNPRARSAQLRVFENI